MASAAQALPTLRTSPEMVRLVFIQLGSDFMKDLYNGKDFIVSGKKYSDLELRKHLKCCGFSVDEINQYIAELKKDYADIYFSNK
jgi:hypothetical protein